MTEQTTTQAPAFPTPARARYEARREEFARARALIQEAERTRLADMIRMEVVALTDLPKSATKADAIEAVVRKAWQNSSPAAEEREMRAVAAREESVEDRIKDAKKQAQKALSEVRKAASAEYPRPEFIMDQAERLAVAQTINLAWGHVAVGIRDHGAEPLVAVEEVAKEVLSDLLSDARSGTHRSSSSTANVASEAVQRGRAAWLNDAARLVPSIPNTRW